MAPRVAIVNMKGGVGKTTLAVNMAHCAARLGKRVLLVDADPQFNATTYVLREKLYTNHLNNPSKCTIYDIYFEKADSPINTVSHVPSKKKPSPSKENTCMPIYSVGNGGRLELIPSKLALMELDSSSHKEKRLSLFLDRIENAYDLIVIDCPPTMTVLTYSAYLASTHYLVPVKPDPLSVVGLPLLEGAMNEFASDSGHSVKQLGLVFSMVRRTKLMLSTMQELSENRGNAIFKTYLSFSTRVARTVSQHKSLLDPPRDPKFASQIIAITNEFLRRLEMT